MRITSSIRVQHLLLALLIVASSPTAHAQSPTPKPVKAKIFKSRAALAATLGKRIGRQVPTSFDFQLFSLVWVALPVAATPVVKIVTLPADKVLRYAHFSAQTIELTRKRTTIEVSIIDDAPCLGGMAKSPEQSAQCARGLQAEIKAARRIQLLFATPQAKLRRAIALQRRTLPRPRAAVPNTP